MADGADEAGAFAVGRLVVPKWAPWTEKKATKSTTACVQTKCVQSDKRLAGVAGAPSEIFATHAPGIAGLENATSRS